MAGPRRVLDGDLLAQVLQLPAAETALVLADACARLHSWLAADLPAQRDAPAGGANPSSVQNPVYEENPGGVAAMRGLHEGDAAAGPGEGAGGLGSPNPASSRVPLGQAGAFGRALGAAWPAGGTSGAPAEWPERLRMLLEHVLSGFLTQEEGCGRQPAG